VACILTDDVAAVASARTCPAIIRSHGASNSRSKSWVAVRTSLTRRVSHLGIHARAGDHFARNVILRLAGRNACKRLGVFVAVALAHLSFS
jgi:hypothetical protein